MDNSKEDFIEYGFSSHLWMAKAVVALADQKQLRLAVISALEVLWTQEDVCVEEVFDRIVQICATGKYVTPEMAQAEYEEIIQEADRILTEQEVERLREDLDKWGTNGDD